jgi:hypothetical protein
MPIPEGPHKTVNPDRLFHWNDSMAPPQNDLNAELRLRLKIPERQALLRSLIALVNDEYTNIHDRRKHNRYVPVHSDATAVLEHPGGSKVSCAILIYDIGVHGIGFATRSYLHQNTPITISMKTSDGEMTKVLGRVTRCEYYDNRFHRVGVVLNSKLDTRIYISEDEWDQHTSKSDNKNWMIPRKALHIESDELEANAIEMMLSNAKISSTNVSTMGKAIDAVQKNSYDLVLLSDTIDTSGVLSTLTHLQSNGYAGPLIVIASTKYSCDKTLSDLGVHSVMPKPIHLVPLISTLRSIFENRDDILSESSDIFTTLTEAQCDNTKLNEFLRVAQELGKQLDACISNDDYPRALKNCNSLYSAGAGFGYPVLSSTASVAVQTLNASCSAQESATEIRKLIRIIARLHGRKAAGSDKDAA